MLEKEAYLVHLLLLLRATGQNLLLMYCQPSLVMSLMKLLRVKEMLQLSHPTLDALQDVHCSILKLVGKKFELPLDVDACEGVVIEPIAHLL